MSLFYTITAWVLYNHSLEESSFLLFRRSPFYVHKKIILQNQVAKKVFVILNSGLKNLEQQAMFPRKLTLSISLTINPAKP